jgi:hypothetical protein
MTQEHPITPPPDELVEQWREDNLTPENLANYVATQAARWGADQELEACLRLVEIDAGEDAYDFARYIRAARRPESPSLKEQALKAARIELVEGGKNAELILRALEALPDD